MPQFQFRPDASLPEGLIDISSRLAVAGIYSPVKRKAAVAELERDGLTIIWLGDVPFSPKREFDAHIARKVGAARAAAQAALGPTPTAKDAPVGSTQAPGASTRGRKA